MSATIQFANNASTTMAGGIAAGAASVVLAAGSAALFPTPASGHYFELTFTDAATQSLIEIVKCTHNNVGTDTLTIVRGQEGTSAQNWAANSIVEQRVTAGDLQFFLQQDGSNYGAFGTGVGKQWEFDSGAPIIIGNNASGPPFTFTTLQTASFTLPAQSPTGAFGLLLKSHLSYAAVTPLIGLTFSGFQEGQVTSRIRDTDFSTNLIPEVGWQYLCTNVGGGFENITVAEAMNNPGTAPLASPLWTYAPGVTVNLSQRVALANTGSYPLLAGLSVSGKLYITAFPL